VRRGRFARIRRGVGAEAAMAVDIADVVAADTAV